MTTKKEAKWQVAKDLLNRHWPINKITAVEGLNKKVSPEQFDRYIEEKNAENLSKFKTGIKKWLQIEDEDVLDIILAGLIGEKIGGDPLWIFLIAPPGGTKTELLRSFSGDYVLHLSDMTSKTLISGLMIGEGKKRRKIEDLLPQLDRKILVFKDFTTLLEKGRDERREIIAQFRDAYDGSYAKKLGTIDKTISYKSRFGLIAGVTPVIDKHWKVMQQLGERFLKVRWNEDMDKITKRAREIEGKESAMREELKENSDYFIESLEFNNAPQFNDEEFGDLISDIAKFVAYARTPISIQPGNKDFYFDYIPTPEMPTRLVKQLKKLAKCLALVRGKLNVTKDEIKTVLRVAKDTVPPDRMAILEVIQSSENNSLLGCSRNRINELVKIPKTSIRRILDQLKTLDLIEEKIDTNDYEKQCFYRTSALYQNIFGMVPEKLEDTKGAE